MDLEDMNDLLVSVLNLLWCTHVHLNIKLVGIEFNVDMCMS